MFDQIYTLKDIRINTKSEDYDFYTKVLVIPSVFFWFLFLPFLVALIFRKEKKIQNLDNERRINYDTLKIGLLAYGYRRKAQYFELI